MYGGFIAQGMGESKHAARGKMHVLREDPNGGAQGDELGQGRGPYRHAESPFMLLAMMRFTSNMSYERLEGYAREMLGDMNASRHAQIYRKDQRAKGGY